MDKVRDRRVHRRPTDFHGDFVEDVVDGCDPLIVNDGHQQRCAPSKVLRQGEQIVVLEASIPQPRHELRAICYIVIATAETQGKNAQDVRA